MPNCRSCQAPIRWAVSEKSGRPMPLDAEPVENGNIVLSGDERNPHATYVSGGAGTHVAHFATCPNANRHRKR